MSTPEIAAKEPFSVEVEAGKKYFWCACGKSAKQPFCDGSHAGTGLAPVLYEAEKSRTVFFCGCKRTAKQPLCDGAHAKL
ncbi:MAG: CDGSH iron-sulfur domain-containing protein [Alphaproteobacteria bacterium]|nr:CDGSH iron-sulfur domain-containing protein [Alphaproteobacteria bacterium]